MHGNTEYVLRLLDEEKNGILQTESIIEYVNNITDNIKSYNTENGINMLYKVKRLCKRMAMPEQTVRMTRNIGMHHFYRNDTKKASKYLDESIRLAKEENLTDMLVGLLSDKGLIYFYDMKYQTAKRLYLKAFELLTCTDRLDNWTKHLLYYRTGLLYCYMKDYDNSILLLNQALEYAEAVINKGWPMINIGVNYSRQGLYNEALHQYNKVLELYGENYAKERSSVYNNIAHVYLNMGEYEIALKNVNKAFELLECKDMSKFFIFFLTYTEIKISQGESREELEKLKELISQIKDFFIYKCFFVYGLNIAVQTSKDDKLFLSKLAEEITMLINKIGKENSEYKRELNSFMRDICLSLEILSSE